MRNHLCLVALVALLVAGCSKPTEPKGSSAPVPDGQTDTGKSQGAGDAGTVEKQPADKPTSPATSVAAGQDRGSFDTSYVAADFCAALVVHPKKIGDANVIPEELLNGVLSEFDLTESGVEGIGDVQQVVLLVDPMPGGNVIFLPAAIVRFAKPVNAKSLLTNNLPDIREQPFLGKTYYTSEEAGMAGVAMAAFVPDAKTLLIAPEPTLQKMLTARDVSSPLVERLKTASLGAEITGPVRR